MEITASTAAIIIIAIILACCKIAGETDDEWGLGDEN